MQAKVSNGCVRELVAERDYLKSRNIQLSESIDETDSRYRMILARLGFDEEGNPIPKEPSEIEPARTGDAAPVESSTSPEENNLRGSNDWFDRAKHPDDR